MSGRGDRGIAFSNFVKVVDFYYIFNLIKFKQHLMMSDFIYSAVLAYGQPKCNQTPACKRT